MPPLSVPVVPYCLETPATLPLHQPQCQPLSICTNTRMHVLHTTQILSFHSQMHKRLYTMNSSRLWVWTAWVTHGSQMVRMEGGGGREVFFCLYISLSTCLRGGNEITVIQLDQREAEIQMLFSFIPLVTHFLPFLFPLFSPLSFLFTPIKFRINHLLNQFRPSLC